MLEGSIKVCDYCSKEHDGSYASGRFCNRGCASGFCTKRKRKEINEKVSNSLTGRPGRKGFHFSFNLTAEQKEERSKKWKIIQKKYAEKKHAKRLILWKEEKLQPGESSCKTLLIFEKGKKCQICGWAEVNPFTNSIPVELEHFDGDCYNNKYVNLTLLCPNHHSLTATFRGANAKKGRGRKQYKLVSAWAKEKKLSVTGSNLVTQ